MINGGICDGKKRAWQILAQYNNIFKENNLIYLPKQTVISALKKLEAVGLITLKKMDDRRSKQLQLTRKGAYLANTPICSEKISYI